MLHPVVDEAQLGAERGGAGHSSIHVQPGAETVAEQSDLINEIGAWVLERSCRDRCRWVLGSAGAVVAAHVK